MTQQGNTKKKGLIAATATILDDFKAQLEGKSPGQNGRYTRLILI